MAKRFDWEKANKKKLMQTRGSESIVEPEAAASPIKPSAASKVAASPRLVKCGVCGIRMPSKDLSGHLAKHEAVPQGR